MTLGSFYGPILMKQESVRSKSSALSNTRNNLKNMRKRSDTCSQGFRKLKGPFFGFKIS
jgi:hypothetical protein